MEFFQTRMGQEFFTKQLPSLIRSLERLGEVLTPRVAMPGMEADPEFLSKLYYGDGALPDGKMTPEGRRLYEKVSVAHEELETALSEEGKRKLDAYDRAATERASYQEERAFEAGVRFAMQTVLAGMARPVDVADNDEAVETK